jgi:hypothetical protein
MNFALCNICHLGEDQSCVLYVHVDLFWSDQRASMENLVPFGLRSTFCKWLCRGLTSGARSDLSPPLKNWLCSNQMSPKTLQLTLSWNTQIKMFVLYSSWISQSVTFHQKSRFCSAVAAASKFTPLHRVPCLVIIDWFWLVRLLWYDLIMHRQSSDGILNKARLHLQAIF